MAHCGSDFSEGRENKCALVHGWVWQCELGSGEDEIAVEQQIEVDDAWAFGRSGGAIAAHSSLNFEKSMKQFEWSECCFEQSRGVDELGLIEIADRCCDVKTGDGLDATECGHAVEGFTQIGVGWPEG